MKQILGVFEIQKNSK